MLIGGDSNFGFGLDFVALIAALALLVVIGGWIYPRIVTQADIYKINIYMQHNRDYQGDDEP